MDDRDNEHSQALPGEELARALAGAAAGDRQEADRLAQAFGPRLRSVVEQRIGPRLATHVTVDDVVQETFLRALRGLKGFEGDGSSFFRWLRTIAENVILESVRGERRGRFLSLDFDLSGSTVSPTSRLQREERKARLDRAMATLSPDHSQVISLVRLQGRSIQETARLLGRSPNATSQLLIRALEKLRLAFGDTDSFSLPEPGPSAAREDASDATG